MKKILVILAIILIFFAAGWYVQYANPPWLAGEKNTLIQLWNNYTKQPTYLNKFNFNGLKQVPVTPKAGRIVQQKTFTMHVYNGMHISFEYPTNITLKQINSQLISLNDPSKKGDNDTLYIYSATVPAKTDNFKIPFTIPGPMTHSKIIKMHGFIANQETYGTGINEVNLLVLRKGSQTIVIRIPQSSKSLNQTITQVVNSIKVL